VTFRDPDGSAHELSVTEVAGEPLRQSCADEKLKAPSEFHVA